MNATSQGNGAPSGEFSSGKIEIPNVERGGAWIEPEFLRLPRPKERCRLSQLSRTTLCELIDEGKIKAVKLRKRGSSRGIVLINRRSLLDYLHSLEK